MAKEITLEVKKNFGVISERKMNKVELRLVSWNSNTAKYDIRGWYTDSQGNEKCAKGICLTEDEIRKLSEITNEIDFENDKCRLLGEIPQNGKYCIRVQLTKYGYDIRVFNGDFGIKGVTFNKDDMIRFKDLMNEVLPEVKETVVEQPKETVKDMDKVVHALTSIPVNDCNYPLKDATADQLREAIEIMENDPNGRHKTRLVRCKAKLEQLNKKADKAEPVEEPKQETVKTEPVNETEEVKEEPKVKGNIITFPKKDTTEIKRLAPTGEHHTYAEAEAKLNKEREMFKGDRDSEYVIDGILEACVSDQELLDNVMRPEKSYVGAFKYFANKAREGYCMRVGNVAVMTADTALKYALDYFNSEEPKPEPKKVPKETTTTKKKTVRKKKAASK